MNCLQFRFYPKLNCLEYYYFTRPNEVVDVDGVIIVKLREREGQGWTQEGHSKVIYRWLMVDILSLELYTKVGCHPPPPTHHQHPQVSIHLTNGQVRLR